MASGSSVCSIFPTGMLPSRFRAHGVRSMAMVLKLLDSKRIRSYLRLLAPGLGLPLETELRSRVEEPRLDRVARGRADLTDLRDSIPLAERFVFHVSMQTRINLKPRV